MNNSEQSPQKKFLRSSEFRYIPCDSISIAVSDNGVKIMLGVEEIDGNTQELVGVHMTHKTAMFLKAALSQGLSHLQQTTGITIEEPELN